MILMAHLHLPRILMEHLPMILMAHLLKYLMVHPPLMEARFKTPHLFTFPKVISLHLWNTLHPLHMAFLSRLRILTAVQKLTNPWVAILVHPKTLTTPL